MRHAQCWRLPVRTSSSAGLGRRNGTSPSSASPNLPRQSLPPSTALAASGESVNWSVPPSCFSCFPAERKYWKEDGNNNYYVLTFCISDHVNARGRTEPREKALWDSDEKPQHCAPLWERLDKDKGSSATLKGICVCEMRYISEHNPMFHVVWEGLFLFLEWRSVDELVLLQEQRPI